MHSNGVHIHFAHTVCSVPCCILHLLQTHARLLSQKFACPTYCYYQMQELKSMCWGVLQWHVCKTHFVKICQHQEIHSITAAKANTFTFYLRTVC